MHPLFEEPSNRKIFLAIFFLTLLGAAIRFYDMVHKPLWFDEAFSFAMAKKDAVTIFQALQNGVDAHPPLYYVLLHYWRLFGTSDFWMRSLSTIFGIALIPLAFAVGKEFFGSRVGLLGAILVTLSGAEIYYSQELRMYSMFSFFAAASFLFLIRIIKQKKTGLDKNAAGFILFSILGIYTHDYGILIVIAELLLLWGLIPSKINAVKISLAVFLATIPCAILLFSQATNTLLASNNFIFGGTGDSSEVFHLFQFFSNNSIARLAFILLAYFGIAGGYKKQSQAVILATGILIIPICLAIIITKLKISIIFGYRYFLPLALLFYVLVAKGIEEITRRRRNTLTVFLAMLVVFMAPIDQEQFQYRVIDIPQCLQKIKTIEQDPVIVARDFHEFILLSRQIDSADNLWLLCIHSLNERTKQWCQIMKRVPQNQTLAPHRIENPRDLNGAFFLFNYENEGAKFFEKDFSVKQTIVCQNLEVAEMIPKQTP